MADRRPRKPKTHVHDAETHKRCFDIYRISRNLSDVQRQIGTTYDTVLRWRSANYVCNHGCPYHGWDELIEQEMAVMAAKEKAAIAGVSDPTEQQKAMELALAKPNEPAPTDRQIREAVALVITDEQQLAHWRHLYAKVYYDLTGTVIDFDTLLQDLTGTRHLFKEELLKRGLRITTAESGVRILGLIADKIKEFERRISGVDVVTTTATVVKQTQEQLLEDAPPDVLRKLLSAVENVSPEGLKAVAEAVEEDED